MKPECKDPNCTRTADYPSGFCRDCHEQSVRTSINSDPQPVATYHSRIKSGEARAAGVCGGYHRKDAVR